MKRRSTKTTIPFLLTCLTLILVASSCNKNDDVEWPDAAVVTFVHGSPKSPLLDVSLDNNRLNLRDFSYTSYWNNQNAYIGERTLSVFKRDENSALFTQSITLEKDKHYTVFLVDSLSNMEAVLIPNTTRGTGQDSVRVKFANMSPDVPSMDFYIKGEATPIATNVAYKSAADFVSLRASFDAVIEVRQAGTSTVLAPSLPLKFSGGNIYTVWASGFKGITTGEGRVTVSSIRHTVPYYWY